MIKLKLASVIIGTALGLASMACLPELAGAWGSLAPSQTHQFILNQAYKQLQADPAYSADLFPSLQDIQENEGVNWTGAGGVLGFDYLKGPGPDSEGASDYSEHYYNPVTGEGKGPDAVSRYWQFTAQGIQTGKKKGTARAAAWGAHFLADMFVPFHVVGAGRTAVKAIHEAGTAAGKGEYITLSKDIYGDYGLCYLCPIKSFSHNFKTEVTRYLSRGIGGPADWFDPWYYNGDSPGLPGMGDTIDPVKSSSHVLWEGMLNHPAYDLRGYDGAWQNGPVRFDSPWGGDQAGQARKFAVLAATETRNNLMVYFQDPGIPINRAIQSVYTLWRSSISALNPYLGVTNANGIYRVWGHVFNKAAEEAKDVAFRLSASGCRIIGGDHLQSIGTALAGVASAEVGWFVEAPGTECRLRMEVVGNYRLTPDLQYAVREKTVPPLGKTSVEIEGPSKMTVDSPVLFIARVAPPAGHTPPPYEYVWTLNGTRLDSPHDTQKARVSSAGPCSIGVEVFQIVDTIRVKMGGTKRTFQVTAAEASAEKIPAPPAPVAQKGCRTIKESYASGRLASERTVCKPYDYGEGLSTTWYENSQIKERAFYKNNLMEGDYTTWYENGVMKGRIQNKEGRMHGKAETWWENGQRRWIEYYVNGKRHGEAHYWDGYGEKTQDCKYENGVELSCKNYEAYRGER